MSKNISDEEIEEVLEGLVQRGLVRKRIENGETLYQVTEEGRAYFREQERLNNPDKKDLNLN